ncbi:G-type lectin S-receptor-like serine/threonine-protein kinase [Camellia lanceoleosa]|uniref:G-type lectin S-receptor-like serine/threonine-protein kinase n=1 Tax=Camellia lanceoleosa TaxID=1840588 RepID=A0ACC0G4P0_9ERIC|nr:G-type lectin S-receptor-like serine/threonine-protein kinase [Camellia lanceoleosa]
MSTHITPTSPIMALPSLSIFPLFLLFLLSNPSPSFSQQPSNIISSFSFSNSPWRPNQNQILLSNNTFFAAGFLPLPTSPKLFIFSIWYHKISTINSTVVWSANKGQPVNPSGALTITRSGELLLNDSSSSQNLWPTKPVGNPNSTQLTLQNNGSLVFGNWLSFSYPTNTILPEQNISGTNLTSNNGKFKFVDSTKLVFNETDSYWHTDNSFDELQPDGKVVQSAGASFICSDFGDHPPRTLRRLTLEDDGNLKIYSLDRSLNQWIVVWQAVQEPCTIHGTCGPNYICMSDGVSDPKCVCPPGFRDFPKSQTCERKIPWNNRTTTKFLRLDYVNYSSGSNQTNLNVQNFSTCKGQCLSNPTCLGFLFKYDGTGYCVPQLGSLLQNGYWSPGTETAMFLRVAESETDESNFTGMTNLMETTCPINISLPLPPEESNTTARNIAIVCTLFAAELISGFLFFWAFLKKYIKYRDMAQTLGLEFLPAGGPKRFSYAELKDATNNFSNIVGRGGFGDVYKGELGDHRVVAVKCLKNVTGGDAEFWAEVTIIARMHHLNLVRLWGFCAEKGQRILVYEYVPNGSLDKFLFSSRRVRPTSTEYEMDAVAVAVAVAESEDKPILDWNIRYRIALGVARAIAYLHEECLEWVLHCDIKPENILLGDDFCPKISDFGLAKLRKKEDMVSMSRIRGTRGYMAPEWVKMDPITPKADVYSFGMVLLEIVSGVRNYEMQGSKMESEEFYFPRWAFEKVFKEIKVEDILDRQIKHSYDSRAHFDMVNRMVKTAMWCLQDRPETRPSMGKVAKMLEGTVEITEPKKPTIFYLGED